MIRRFNRPNWVFRSLLSAERQNLPCGVAGAVTLALVATGGWLATPALAEPVSDRVLLAQQVVDGLPPPPPLIYNQQALPPAQSAQPARSNPAVQVPTRVETRVPEATMPQERYLVYVNGNSPLLLAQVRKFESNAFLQNYSGRQVIQTGLFNDQASAQQQITTLAAQGIEAQVSAVSSSEFPTSAPQTVTQIAPQTTPQTVNVAASSTLPAAPNLVPVTQAPREVDFGQPPSLVSQTTVATAALADNAYYVVVPTRSRNLEAAGLQVIRLSGGLITEGVIRERTAPLGPHVLVGPFVNRRAAARWSRYYRDFGLDARVYYRR